MSLGSSANRNDYAGTDAVGVYAYTFRIFQGQQSQLLVTVRNITTGVETPLVLNTDYTVSGDGNASGGNITLLNASQAWLKSGTAFLSAGYKLTIRRVVPLTQTTNVRNQGDFFPEIHEDEFDYLTMIDQQQQDEIDRSVKLPETVSEGGFSTTLPANLAGSPGAAIVVNAAGTGFDLGVVSATMKQVFGFDTYANLKAAAAALPTVMRMGWAKDIKQWMGYTTDVTVGDGGWIVLG